jgi:hypothetical protein
LKVGNVELLAFINTDSSGFDLDLLPRDLARSSPETSTAQLNEGLAFGRRAPTFDQWCNSGACRFCHRASSKRE